MSATSNLNLLGFSVSNLFDSHWERQFKFSPCNTRGSHRIYLVRTIYVLPVPVSSSDSQLPATATFWPCRPSATLQASQAQLQSGGRGLPELGGEGCCEILLLAQDSPRLQPAPCSHIKSSEEEEPARSWLQKSL